MDRREVFFVVFCCLLATLEPVKAQNFQRFISPGGFTTSQPTRPPTTVSTPSPAPQSVTNSPGVTNGSFPEVTNDTLIRAGQQPVAVDVTARLSDGSSNAARRRFNQQSSMRVFFTEERTGIPMSQRAIMTFSSEQQRATLKSTLVQNGQIVKASALIPGQVVFTQNGDPVPIFIGEKVVVLDGQVYAIDNGKVSILGRIFIVCNDTLALEVEFICCVSEVYLKSAGDFLCCAGNIFFPSTEICCQGLFYPKTVQREEVLCCSLVSYTPATEFCCQGAAFMKGNPQVFSCCDETVISVFDDVCCENSPVPRIPGGRCCGKTHIPPNVQCCNEGIQGNGFTCCGTTAVNPETSLCCSGVPTPKSPCGCFDSNQFICCSGVPTPITPCGCFDSNQFICCSGVPTPRTPCGCFDSNQFICCSGVPTPKTPCGCFDSNQFICCNGVINPRGPSGPSQCCGLASYNPATAACCSNTLVSLAQVPCGCSVPNGLSCCGGSLYNPASQTCCGHHLTPRNAVPCGCSTPPGFSCCGGTLINTRSQICCGNHPTPRGAAACGCSVPPGFGCCSGILYNRYEQVCCGRKIVHKHQARCGCFLPSGLQCCGGATFNPTTQRCCSGKVYYRRATPCGCSAHSGSVCCDGLVQPTISGTQCCGKRLFFTANQVCCNEIVYTRATAPCSCLPGGPSCDVNRCGSQLFNPTTHVCCANAARRREEGKVCCGNLLVNPEHFGCCRRIPYLRSLACCKGGRSIEIHISGTC